MNRKLSVLVVVLLLSALVLSACNQAASTTPGVTTPSASLLISPSPSPSSSAGASATPGGVAEAIPTPDEAAPTENPSIIYDWPGLAKESSIVVRGTYVKKLPELYNAIRSFDDPAEPDPLYIIDQEQHEFKITEVYKNDEKLKSPLKAGDTIVVNTPYSDRYTSGAASKMDPTYMEIKLQEDTLLFLVRFDFNPDQPVYQPETDIYSFSVKDGTVFPQSYDQKKADAWLKEVKAPNGVPLANVKKDLNVK